MVPASVRHTSFFGVRPRSGHLQAIGCTRWLLDGCFTTMDVPAHAVVVAFLFLWECRFLLCCWIAQLLMWLVICVSRVSCDFVSRLGGRDTNIFSKGRQDTNGWLIQGRRNTVTAAREEATAELLASFSTPLSKRKVTTMLFILVQG